MYNKNNYEICYPSFFFYTLLLGNIFQSSFPVAPFLILHSTMEKPLLKQPIATTSQQNWMQFDSKSSTVAMLHNMSCQTAVTYAVWIKTIGQYTALCQRHD